MPCCIPPPLALLLLPAGCCSLLPWDSCGSWRRLPAPSAWRLGLWRAPLMLLLALPSVLLLLQMEAERQQRIREDVAAELRVFYCEVLLLLPPPLASCPQGALTATRVQPAAGRCVCGASGSPCCTMLECG